MPDTKKKKLRENFDGAPNNVSSHDRNTVVYL